MTDVRGIVEIIMLLPGPLQAAPRYGQPHLYTWARSWHRPVKSTGRFQPIAKHMQYIDLKSNSRTKEDLDIGAGQTGLRSIYRSLSFASCFQINVLHACCDWLEPSSRFDRTVPRSRPGVEVRLPVTRARQEQDDLDDAADICHWRISLPLPREAEVTTPCSHFGVLAF